MGFKKCTSLLIILFITVSLLSSSTAGGQRKFIKSIIVQGQPKEEFIEEVVKHGRILKVQTNDYGSYDPSPTMNKPHFKDIPN